MMLNEPGAERLAKRLADEPAGQRFLSCANYIEAGTVLAGRAGADTAGAVRDLESFVSRFLITLTSVDEEQARAALEARIHYGRGFGAPAKLNYGDCLAYALARALDAPLLYVGDDFAKTDIISAL